MNGKVDMNHNNDKPDTRAFWKIASVLGYVILLGGLCLGACRFLAYTSQKVAEATANSRSTLEASTIHAVFSQTAQLQMQSTIYASTVQTIFTRKAKTVTELPATDTPKFVATATFAPPATYISPLPFTPTATPTSCRTPQSVRTKPGQTWLPPPPTYAPPTNDPCCKHCGPNSQPCGDSCISLEYVCHQPPGCACNGSEYFPPTSPSTPNPVTATVAAALTQAAISIQTIIPTSTLPELSLEEQFARVDAEIKKNLPGSFSYTAPTAMNLDETFTIQLLLNPSLTPEELATLLVEESNLTTNTSVPGELVTESGEAVDIVGGIIEVTPRMKAILVSEDPEAFTVQRLHDDDVQMIGRTTTTKWQWTIKARKEGNQKLIIVISQLVKTDGKEFWYEVETYQADINVKVTLGQRIKSWDWKWLASVLLVPVFWKIYDAYMKMRESRKSSASRGRKEKKTRGGK